ncbi:MAG: hypothetical protein K0S32_1596 [Bacteroidetes bacterium]|jgi:hypothetical protein|nr:hypothetical protein [Bacteroidota bacterium]
MKTNIVKVTLVLLVFTVAISLSSFTGSKKMHVTTKPVTVIKYESEYAAVRAFVEDNITTPIREQGTANGVKIKSFSRCPSGYRSNIAGSSDSVKTSKFAYGKINLYKGCSPVHVCDFRVCVDKAIAEVKNKGDKEYMTVREWLEENNSGKQEDVKTVKESPKEIKG